MYTIIGGDQKEYGPISAEDVRQWIAEGRLNEKSQVKGEGDAEFRPLETFSEFAICFTPSSSMPKLPPSAFAVALPPETPVDYELDIAGCISRGFELVKKNFGLLFVATLVAGVLAFALFCMLSLVFSIIIPQHLMGIAGFKVGFNLFLSVVSAFVIGPLTGGYYLTCLKSIRDEPRNLGDIFLGFQNSFLELALGYLVVVLCTGLCMVPFNYALTAKLNPLLAQMQNATPGEIQNLSPQVMSAFISALPILLICMIPVIYLSVNWLFTQALIIDKQTDFRTAMKASWRMVHKHWWHVFGLVVITGLINIAGFFFCCIGMLFTFPVGIAALMYAYETIFPEGPAA